MTRSPLLRVLWASNAAIALANPQLTPFRTAVPVTLKFARAEHSAAHAHHGHHSHAHATPAEKAARQKIDAVLHSRIIGGSAARALADFYRGLDYDGRAAFFHVLAEEDTIDLAAVEKHLHAWNSGFRNHTLLRADLAPRYEKAFNSLLQLPDGVGLLVDMRAQLLSFKRHPRQGEFNSIAESIKSFVRSGFAPALLELGRITPQSGQSMLSKFEKYEAVHPLKDMDDILHRTGGKGPGRIVFALFSRAVQEEPLAFVEVALLPSIATSIQGVLEEKEPGVAVPPEKATTAIFYSITQATKGLTGVDLGQVLLKKVLADLKQKLPNITTYCTLSPMPGFRKWFDGLENEEQEKLGLTAELRKLLGTEWWTDKASAEKLKPVLMKAAVRYLTHERRGRNALDSVGELFEGCRQVCSTELTCLSLTDGGPHMDPQCALSPSFRSQNATSALRLFCMWSSPNPSTTQPISIFATAHNCTTSISSATTLLTKASRMLTGSCAIISMCHRSWTRMPRCMPNQAGSR